LHKTGINLANASRDCHLPWAPGLVSRNVSETLLIEFYATPRTIRAIRRSGGVESRSWSAEVIEEEESAAPREAAVSHRWQPHGLFSHRSGLSSRLDEDTSPNGNENHPVTPLFTEVGPQTAARPWCCPLLPLPSFTSKTCTIKAGPVEANGGGACSSWWCRLVPPGVRSCSNSGKNISLLIVLFKKLRPSPGRGGERNW
jgi:hypothetical protein